RSRAVFSSSPAGPPSACWRENRTILHDTVRIRGDLPESYRILDLCAGGPGGGLQVNGNSTLNRGAVGSNPILDPVVVPEHNESVPTPVTDPGRLPDRDPAGHPGDTMTLASAPWLRRLFGLLLAAAALASCGLSDSIFNNERGEWKHN